MDNITPAALKTVAESDLENLIAATTPGGIEAQEAEGQRQFTKSQTLPKDCPREDLEALGFVFGEGADDIFINVSFPDGWSIKPTEHSMWSDLLDDKGRKRAGVFYKAAFYDRNAHMSLDVRYTVRQNYDLPDGQVQYRVFDCDESIFYTEVIESEQYSDEYFAISDKLKAIALDWMNSKYPDHRDPKAYWD